MSVAKFGRYIFFALLFCVVLQPAWADIPPPSPDKPTLVNVDLKLEDINDIKLGSGTFDLTAQFGMRWHDPRLEFEPRARNSSYNKSGIRLSTLTAKKGCRLHVSIRLVSGPMVMWSCVRNSRRRRVSMAS